MTSRKITIWIILTLAIGSALIKSRSAMIAKTSNVANTSPRSEDGLSDPSPINLLGQLHLASNDALDKTIESHVVSMSDGLLAEILSEVLRRQVLTWPPNGDDSGSKKVGFPKISANLNPHIWENVLQCNKGYESILLGSYAIADSLLNSCITFLKDHKLEFGHLYGHSLHNLARSLQEQGSYDESLRYYYSALEYRNQNNIDSQLDRAATLNNIGNVFWKQGEFYKALSFHERSLLLKEKLLSPDHPDISSSLNNIGVILNDMGEHERALEYHNRAYRYRLASLGEHISTAHSLNNISESLFFLGKLNSAIDSLKSAIEIKRMVVGPNHPSYFNSLGLLAYFYSNTGRYTKADSLLNITNNFCSNNRSYICTDIDIIGINHMINQNDLKLATSYIELLRSKTENLSKVYLDLASGHLKSNNYKQSIFFAKQAIHSSIGIEYNSPHFSSELSTNTSDHDLLLKATDIIYRSHLQLAEIANRVTNLALAQDAVLNAIDIFDESRTDPWIDITQKKAAFLVSELSGKAIDISLQLYKLTTENEYLFRAFEFADYRNNWALNSQLSDLTALARAGADDNLIREFKRLISDLIDAKRKQNIAGSPSSKEEIDLSNTIFKLKEELSKKRAIILSTYPLYKDFRSNHANLSLAILHHELQKHDANIIQYFSYNDRLLAFVISHDKIKLFDLEQKAKINILSEELRKSMDPRLESAYVGPSKVLYNVLFQPLESALDATNLIIVPNSATQDVSFEALISSEIVDLADPSHHEYLIENYSVEYSYSSFSFFAKNKSVSESNSIQFMGIAPVFDQAKNPSQKVAEFLAKHSESEGIRNQNVLPLNESAVEIKSILNSYDKIDRPREYPPNSKILLREKATEKQIKNTKLQSVNVLHLATHSFSDLTDPFSSGILVELNPQSTDNEDGILYASEVYGLELNAELVTLSACETARSTGNQLGSLSGFAGGFFFAGAKNLLASLWPSDDIGTRVLMEHFYSLYWSGIPLSTALRKTKLLLLNDDGPISHPYYWSGFVHIGSSAPSTSGDVDVQAN